MLHFTFSSKNKKLSNHIEDISQRLEDQEDVIQKHEQIIRQLVQAINTQKQTRSFTKLHNKQKNLIKRPVITITENKTVEPVYSTPHSEEEEEEEGKRK